MQGNAKCGSSETSKATSASEAESPSSPPSSQPPTDRPRRRRYRRSTQPERPRIVDDAASQAIWIVGFECGVLGPYELSRAGRAEARSDLAGVVRFYADELQSAIEKTDEK